ncbi:type II toxin-antitoxin system RelE/ParE family toxin [Galbibacter mesophilus]|uniref:type II toxin-antitoxin system RelE/ParE family toxin n=1 Tax=Galbibacter mesophilus TaxID=379069 RepID=UPI00191F3EC2|nr:type II toxin-antitoxin system RelE/ParE family toxin [Galbibacter mesophilus]MCM5663222.1 type II toxin-antitoxin system RelE/ParE family toxin [Galbibacter mesophilus]
MHKYTVVFEEDAKSDIADSYDWYNKISSKIADNFLHQIENSISYLERDPFLFQIVYKDFRQVTLKKYPFVLVFKIDNKIVKIYRAFATKKNPSSKF